MEDSRGLIDFITCLDEEDEDYIDEYLKVNKIDYENFKDRMLDYLEKKKKMLKRRKDKKVKR